MEKEQRVVIVTGSSRGIGAAIAEKFASLGDSVVILYHQNKEKALLLKQELEAKYSVQTLCMACDVTSEDNIKEVVQNVIKTFGRIDVLVNNAGIDQSSFVSEKTKEDFIQLLDVNLIGPFLFSRAVAPFMQEQKKGSIINISSTNGMGDGHPMSLEYDASKAGLNSLTKNLAKEYAPYIRVNALAPGWVKTDMAICEDKEVEALFIKEESKNIFLQRFAEPSEIASTVSFLASSAASYINGTIIRIDGGY
ncbi:MAG: glucose 1-dehydrogenase [Bacilli bacterium]|nr:glucose 1-dehydrogenase [Bacilli bacterium]